MDALGNGFAFDMFEQTIAVSQVTIIRMDCQASELTGLFFRKRIQRCAAQDYTIVFKNRKAINFNFQQLTIASHQNAFSL